MPSDRVAQPYRKSALLPELTMVFPVKVVPSLFLKPTEPAVAKVVQRLAQGASFEARQPKPVIDVTAAPHGALVLPATAGAAGDRAKTARLTH